MRFFCSLLSKSEGVFFFFSFLFFFPASEDKDYFRSCPSCWPTLLRKKKTFRNFKGTNKKFHLNQNKKQLFCKVAKAFKTSIIKYHCILYYSNTYGWIRHKANKQLSSSNKKVLYGNLKQLINEQALLFVQILKYNLNCKPCRVEMTNKNYYYYSFISILINVRFT